MITGRDIKFHVENFNNHVIVTGFIELKQTLIKLNSPYSKDPEAVIMQKLETEVSKILHDRIYKQLIDEFKRLKRWLYSNTNDRLYLLSVLHEISNIEKLLIYEGTTDWRESKSTS
jgi:hypothetical protein